MRHEGDLVFRLPSTGDIGDEAAPAFQIAVASAHRSRGDRPPVGLPIQFERHDEVAERLLPVADGAQFLALRAILEQQRKAQAFHFAGAAPRGLAEPFVRAKDRAGLVAFDQPVASVLVVLVEQQLNRFVRFRQVPGAQAAGGEHVMQVEQRPVHECHDRGNHHARQQTRCAGAHGKRHDHPGRKDRDGKQPRARECNGAKPIDHHDHHADRDERYEP